MTKKYKLHFSLWAVILVLSSICAQAQTADKTPSDAQSRTPLVSATATAEQIRFVSPGEVIQMRLEVFAAGGEKLFDSNLKFGNLLDWPLQDQQGQRLPDGTYLCTITVKDLAGHTSSKYGAALVQGGQVSLSPPEEERLSDGQRQLLESGRKSQAPGTEASNDYFTILREGTVIPTTALAHDGINGQLVTSSGALSFRAGDFFAGKNVERMRLTAEGDLGLGVEAPKSKLDVAGAIRTSEGIVFPDGSVQTTAYLAPGRILGGDRGRLQRDAQGRSIAETGNKAAEPEKSLRLTPNISGTGTMGKIPKWLDNSGALGDSVVTELSGNLGIGPGTTSPGEKLSVGYGANTDIAIGSATNNKTYLGSFNNNTVFAINRRVSDGNFANPGLPTASFGFYTSSGDSSIRFGTANTNGALDTERVRIDKNGNVGIGTPSPGEKLSVGYGANTDIAIGSATNNKSYLGSFNNNVVFAINRRVNDGVFANPGLPTASFGFYTSSGDSSIRFNTSGTNGVLDTERMRIDKNGNVGIGTIMPSSPLTVVGSTIPALPIIAGINNGTGVGVYGNANTGVYGLSPVSGGEGVLGVTFGGSSKAVHGVDQFGGFAGFFEGKAVITGNVGIGINNPLSKLHVAGGTLIEGNQPGVLANANNLSTGGAIATSIGLWGNSGITFVDLTGFGRIGLIGSGVNTGVFGWSDTGNAVSAFSSGQARFAATLRASNGNSNQGMAAYITNSSNFATAHFANSSNGEVLYLQNGGTDAAGASGGDFIKAVNNPENDAQFRVLSSGEVRSDVGFNTPAADFAEMLPAEAGLEPGDVLVIGEDSKLTRSTVPRQTNVAGVYSTQPGFVGGQPVNGKKTGTIPLAVVGIIPVKVTAENGPIRPGDMLTTSSTPGHAMRAGANPILGTVIGKALGSLKQGTGVIQILAILH